MKVDWSAWLVIAGVVAVIVGALIFASCDPRVLCSVPDTASEECDADLTQ